MKSDNLRLACVHCTTSNFLTNMTIDTLHLFRKVVGGDFWQLPLEKNTTDRDRTEGIDRTEKTDGTDRTDRTDRDTGPIEKQPRR